MPTLHYSRNPNPRPALNPTQRIPILVEDGQALWEADAIACRLSQMVGADFWRQGGAQPDMIRGISWGKETFVRACDMVQYELGTKRRYGQGPTGPALVAEGTARFHEAAAILDRHLVGRDWLTGTTPSHADFRMATFLPFNDIMRLPLDAYPALAAWNSRLEGIAAWADPFDGLDTPDLPPVLPA